QLTELDCFRNDISSLDVSKNTQLTWLYCNKNNLSHLGISKNTALTVLSLWGNKFSTATLDAIYCRIPDMTGQPRKGYILPVHETSSATEQNNVNATNAKNATDKNWRVVIYKNDDTIDDITTTGTYDCSTSVADASAEQHALTLYPNPMSDVLYLSATARTIRVYDMYGTEVAHATDTDRVEVSHLPAGVYTVRADGMVAKMIKR
ncbi:MAG: T9SS type A sorting domain-containing protein, partial [Bacteroidota bacterium]